MYRTPGQRAATITGLRALADYLETHPDVPVSRFVEMSVHPAGPDPDRFAEVDRIATLIHATPGPTYEGSEHYGAARSFGGGVTYRAIAIPVDHMARHEAHMSYWDNVTP